MKKLVVEFIGTFFLVFTIGCSVASGSVIAAFSIGAILMVMVYAGGHISGAHYNPAVSFAVFIRGRIKLVEMIQYWVVQGIGGLLGAICSYYLTLHNEYSVINSPRIGLSPIHAVIAEMIGTFALAYVVLNVATSKNTSGNSYFGLAIGFTVFAMAVSLGHISGGAFNPAVGVGRNMADFFTAKYDTAGFAWIYIVGPLLGGGLAGLVFNFLNPDDK